jgi:hypothetical protein
MNEVSSRDLCIAYALLPFLTPPRIRLLLEHLESLADAQGAPSISANVGRGGDGDVAADRVGEGVSGARGNLGRR